MTTTTTIDPAEIKEMAQTCRSYGNLLCCDYRRDCSNEASRLAKAHAEKILGKPLTNESTEAEWDIGREIYHAIMQEIGLEKRTNN